MAQFTPEQLEQTAEQYHQLAASLFVRRMAFLRASSALDDPRIVQLQSRQISLDGIANQYAVEAAGVRLEDAESAADLVGSSLSRANAAIQHVSAIERAVSIASAAINLSLAIHTGNLPQIVAAAEALSGEASETNELAMQSAVAETEARAETEAAPLSGSVKSSASETAATEMPEMRKVPSGVWTKP